ncbi:MULTISPECIES: hypothetical protein [unclassified Bradyrhizobium]|uniref:hypothetical protein n=1 Tax=unclassified Bradyrhizobium TaxID=2631580 RepID=UPI0028EA9544|nr:MULTISPECIES: hypothetical protein [unclassified Bradyrhizobium]
MSMRLHKALALSVGNGPMARILSHRPCGAEKVSLLAAIEHAMFGDEFLKDTFANNVRDF